MEHLIEILINKRLGRHCENKINNSLLYGDYYHMACVIENNKSEIIPLSYGMNVFCTNKSLHAECDAIKHLPPRKRSHKNKIINLVVIRTSINGKISISKPCVICMSYLCTMPQKKGYQINKIFYSTENGEIVENTIDELKQNTTHFSKFYRQNYNNK